ncbi:hypothetical protein JI747_012005 [Chryseobacterium sp. RG1]|uniref:Uncharacterized protein n=1 Tax=Chryseobacterium tagetis TaxID=2801334 RepID=A0ABS8A3A5_9FLAO|nr:hypothetical protein [Chryseobacterium tagetis]MCA6067908.1 hypothetical protein [Chryseobacterium tagetis]
MEKNELTTREKLKTYFETGKHPTENQFSDLIDSLKHRQDTLTDREVIIIANGLATLDKGYIQYYINNVGDLKFPIVISSQDEEDQVINIGSTNGNEKKQYFYGNAPYTVKAKGFPAEGLGETEYYYLNCQIDEFTSMIRLYGNSLPTIPDGFEFGTLTGKNLILQMTKQNLGQRVNIVNTGIKLVNKTQVPIQYMPQSSYWTYIFTADDMVTDHYNAWDYLYLYYKADLREIDQSIECKVYDADNETLLMTTSLNARQNNQNVWAGDTIMKVRNIRIECEYQNMSK